MTALAPSVADLRAYYATPGGRRVARTLAAIAAPAVRRTATSRLLALGYCAPLLAGLDPAAVERLALVMPGAEGAHRWPAEGQSCAAVADAFALPFPDAVFDQALLCHALEFADPPRAALRELWRVLAPAGAVLLIVPNRAGLWTHFEATPFGNGRPFGRGQLDRLLRDSLFEPVAWRTALVAPPVRGFGWLDRPLTKVASRLGGIHFVLAKKVDGLSPTLVGKAKAATAKTAAA